jgi:hypothetical protein
LFEKLDLLPRGDALKSSPRRGVLPAKLAFRHQTLVRSPVHPPARAAANKNTVPPAFDNRIICVDEVALGTNAARELDLAEALLDGKVCGIAAPCPDTLFGRKGVLEPGALGKGADEDLEVNSWSLSLFTSHEDPSVALGIAGSGVLPASGLGMKANASAQSLLSELHGIYRTITYYPPIDTV